MLFPIIKEEGVTDSEKFLAQKIGDTFFSIWSYPNVYTDEGFSKNKEGKELCDLLVVIDQVAILFSDKDIKFNKEIDIHTAWKRWFKKSIIKSASQLFGAEQAIKLKRNNLYLDKKCTTELPVNINKVTEIHLISVTRNTKELVKEYFSSDSGSLYCAFHYNAQECLEHPFFIGDLYPEKNFIHIFDDYSLSILMDELSTITDFIHYLRSKVNAIRKENLFAATGEEELLASFVKGMFVKKNTVGEIHIPVKNKDKHAVLLSEGLWEELLYDNNYIYLKENIKKFNYLDFLAKNLSDSILNATVGLNKDSSFSSHEQAVKYLSLEPRLSRAVISQSIMEKYEDVPSNVRSARLIPSLHFKERIFIMLFFPRDKNQNYEVYREERVNILHSYCLVAKYLLPKYSEFIAIATEPQNSDGRSEDILYAEYKKPLDRNERDIAKELKKNGVLNDVNELKLNLTSLLPDHANKEKKTGRNSPCPCGSKIKFKRCCG